MNDYLDTSKPIAPFTGGFFLNKKKGGDNTPPPNTIKSITYSTPTLKEKQGGPRFFLPLTVAVKLVELKFVNTILDSPVGNRTININNSGKYVNMFILRQTSLTQIY